MAAIRSCLNTESLKMEGIVVAVDDEGVMLEVFDQKRRCSYHFFAPFGMMPPALCNQIDVGSIVRVRSWHERGQMFMSMQAVGVGA